MSFIKKICAPLLLSASLVFGLIGTASIAEAAETPMDVAALETFLDEVKTATDKMVSENTVETTENIVASGIEQDQEVEFGRKGRCVCDSQKGICTEEFELDLGVLGQSFGITEPVKWYNAYDYNNMIMYTNNDPLDICSVMPVKEKINHATFTMDLIVPSALAGIATVTEYEAELDGVDSKVVKINIKAEGEELKQAIPILVKAFGGAETGEISTASMAFSDDIKSIDFTISFCVSKETLQLNKTVIEGTEVSSPEIQPDGSSDDEDKVAQFECKFENAVVDEIVELPPWTKDAQLVPGVSAKKSGMKFATVYDLDNNTIFQVTGVTKTSAKKLTIPASIKKYGKSYKVTKAQKNAFKKAKKLKTLVVKNSKLKKAIKKNPTKYGLKKSVKIK
ncbi:MAG: hypothetical protein K5639_06130 [Eubacterium sp.]|nr:hypothetical protein [Eubacterium sp.]